MEELKVNIYLESPCGAVYEIDAPWRADKDDAKVFFESQALTTGFVITALLVNLGLCPALFAGIVTNLIRLSGQQTEDDDLLVEALVAKHNIGEG